VTVRLWGGLCNNLFQIGAIMGYAYKYNCEYRIYENLFDVSQHTSKNETLNIIAKIFPSLYIDSNKEINESHFDKIIEVDGDDAARYVILPSPDNNNNDNNKNNNNNNSKMILLKGYFQSNKYFSNSFNDSLMNGFKVLINQYRISRNTFTSMGLLELSATPLPKKESTYFIHVRMGDYMGHYLLYLGYKTYLTNAVKYINSIEKDNQGVTFLICSNETDKEKVKNELGDVLGLMKNYIFETDYNPKMDPLVTLINMSECAGGICMNSSFSWFGAYICNSLNFNKSHIVMPSKWFNDSIIPYYRYKDIYPTNISSLQIINI
jgi:hypothetical protein